MFLGSLTCNCPLLKNYTQFNYIQEAAYISFLQSCIPSLLPWCYILLWSFLFILLFKFCRLDARWSASFSISATANLFARSELLRCGFWWLGAYSLLPKEYLYVFGSFKTQNNPLFVYFLNGGGQRFSRLVWGLVFLGAFFFFFF